MPEIGAATVLCAAAVGDPRWRPLEPRAGRPPPRRGGGAGRGAMPAAPVRPPLHLGRGRCGRGPVSGLDLGRRIAPAFVFDGGAPPIAFDVKFEDGGAVHEAVDGGDGHGAPPGGRRVLRCAPKGAVREYRLR